MGKLLKCVTLAVLCLFIGVVGSVKAAGDEFEGTRLVGLIANHIRQNGEAEPEIVGSPDREFTRHTLKYYTGTELVLLSLRDFKNGTNELSIDIYVSTTHFLNLKNPADVVAEELIWGKPRINIERHIVVDGKQGKLRIYQEFTKKRSRSYLGFTREERDRGKKAGVSEYLYDDDGLMVDGKRKKLSDRELKEILEGYVAILRDITDHFHLR